MTVDEAIEEVYRRFDSLLSSFNDYFGEEYVDKDVRSVRVKLLSIHEDIIQKCDTFDDAINKILNRRSEDLDRPAFTIIIYRPEVVIQNEREETHTIKDLYIKLAFNNLMLSVEGVRMNRSTYSYIGACKGYIHSHCQSNTDLSGEFRTCCLGKTALSTVISAMKSIWEPGFTETLPVLLDQYIHVESVSGGPYQYMADLNIEKSDRLIYTQYSDTSDVSVSIPDIKYLVKTFLVSGNIKLAECDGRVKLSYIPEELAVILSDLAEGCPWNIPLYKGFQDSFGYIYMYNIPEITDIDPDTERILFKFKGEPVRLRVEPKDDTILNLRYFIQPKVYSVFVDIVESLLTAYAEKYTSEQAIPEKYRKYRNSRGHSE